MKYKEIAERIIELKNADLEFREKLVENGQLSQGYNEGMAKIHNNNAKILNEIIDTIGYPTVEKVGEAASEAGWLVIQPFIGRPAFMRKCVDLLKVAVVKTKPTQKV